MNDSGIEITPVDLVTVAQAPHWFKLELFYGEVKRVLGPAGVLAVWGCGAPRNDDQEISALLEEFRTQTLGSYWPEKRCHVDNTYIESPFPFADIATADSAPTFKLAISWSLPRRLGYLRSWTAFEVTGRAAYAFVVQRIDIIASAGR